ncbi:hypothetical protein GGP55_003328 [Salinibacter ruber]|uniref:hypothetical protein n=1 Tax=Salinibacter TaxID=146918 RepID=UPI002169441E|nr:MULTISPECIES: hypothetical protein [Salinibacter]MCS3632706.1 hypothetical protein [Salinibacter ruber]
MTELVELVALAVAVVLVQSAYTADLWRSHAVAVVLVQGARNADLWKPHARPETPCTPSS